MAEVRITPVKDGPYLVQGPVDVVDSDGRRFPVEGTVALCRCGASGQKPFCDGSHKRIAFTADTRAPKPS